MPQTNMKKQVFLLICACICCLSVWAQNKDQQAILDLLETQRQAWNRGDIPTFMQGYWNNEGLMFIGKSGVTKGYQNTLENYKKGYQDTAAMGKLQFDILEVRPISKEYYFVVGKWFLKRSIGDVGGHYTLLVRKIKGKWLIVADHSS
jgi:ketosteroid isomerase-like protein